MRRGNAGQQRHACLARSYKVWECALATSPAVPIEAAMPTGATSGEGIGAARVVKDRGRETLDSWTFSLCRVNLGHAGPKEAAHT